MSGETEKDVSGWTTDTLFQLMNTKFKSQETAMSAALAAAEKAVIKAENASEKRFESVNEFRAALTDLTATFIPRAEAENRIAANQKEIVALQQDGGKYITRDEYRALSAKFDDAASRFDKFIAATAGAMDQRNTGRQSIQWSANFAVAVVVGALGFLLAIGSLLVTVFRH